MSTRNITVKTLDNAGLYVVTKKLSDITFKNFTPDIIIGIRTGGYIVAEIMVQETQHNPTILAISRQRPSTKKKDYYKRLKNILQLLPYAVTDYLRIWEHKKLTEKPPQPLSFTPDANELTALRKALRTHTNAKILIVDDAIDSGATMKAVLDLLQKEANPTCIIKSAAITVTTDYPLIKPDYSLYNHVLIRFPWSSDFKNQSSTDYRS